MKCSMCREKLHSYVKTSLDEAGMQAIQSHLESCADCMSEYTAIKKARNVLSGCGSKLTPPPDLMQSIMSSINLNKYKDFKRIKLAELRNWGASMVAAGFIMLILNAAPGNVGTGGLQDTTVHFVGSMEQQIARPINYINNGINSFTKGLIDLNGITGRMEKQVKGGI